MSRGLCQKQPAGLGLPQPQGQMRAYPCPPGTMPPGHYPLQAHVRYPQDDAGPLLAYKAAHCEAPLTFPATETRRSLLLLLLPPAPRARRCRHPRTYPLARHQARSTGRPSFHPHRQAQTAEWMRPELAQRDRLIPGGNRVAAAPRGPPFPEGAPPAAPLLLQQSRCQCHHGWCCQEKLAEAGAREAEERRRSNCSLARGGQRARRSCADCWHLLAPLGTHPLQYCPAALAYGLALAAPAAHCPRCLVQRT